VELFANALHQPNRVRCCSSFVLKKSIRLCTFKINEILGLTTSAECDVQSRREELKEMKVGARLEILKDLCLDGMRWYRHNPWWYQKNSNRNIWSRFLRFGLISTPRTSSFQAACGDWNHYKWGSNKFRNLIKRRFVQIGKWNQKELIFWAFCYDQCLVWGKGGNKGGCRQWQTGDEAYHCMMVCGNSSVGRRSIECGAVRPKEEA